MDCMHKVLLKALALLSFFFLSMSLHTHAAQEVLPSLAPSSLRVAIPIPQSMAHSTNQSVASFLDFTQDFWLQWSVIYKQEVSFVYLSPEEMPQALKQNKVDIASFGLTQAKSDDFIYSLPYAKYNQPILRRLSSKNQESTKIGIHSSNFTTLDFLNEGVSREYFFDIDSLLSQYQNFDAIYSLQPWKLEEQIKKRALHEKFYINNNETSERFVHFYTLKSNRVLAHKVNDHLRNISSTVLQNWTQKYFSAQDAHFKLTLDAYISDISMEEKEYVLDHTLLYYPVTKEGVPPYIIPPNVKNIQTHGLTIDITRIITQRTGIIFTPYHVESLDFNEIEKDHLDVILQSEYSSNVKGSFSNVYLTDSYSMITREYQLPIYSLRNFTNEKMGAIRDLNAISLPPEVKPQLYPSLDDALKALSHNEIDYLIAPSLTSAYTLKEKELLHFTTYPLVNDYHKKQFRFAILEHNEALRTLLNRGIKSISAHTFNDLYNQWNYSNFQEKKLLHNASSVYQKNDYFIFAAAFIVLCLFWFLYHQYSLRSQHQEALEEALELAETAKIAAEKSAQAKITFLARMSHEIRTPMNGVLGMAEALTYTDLNTNQKDLLETLNGAATNLLALLNDVLDFSKMDAGKLTLEAVPVNFTTLFKRIVNAFKHIKNEKNIEIKLNLDDRIAENYYADPTRLTQVLNNLMSNAIKFTHQGFICLSLKLIEEDNKNNAKYDTLQISVQDTGIGIPQKHQGSLFTPFIQADDDITRKFGGTGLGLSICHEIVTAMGSVIHLDSHKNEGSTFSFTLKLKHAIGQKTNEERRKNLRTVHASNDNRFDNLRVLIAEDNLINIQVLSAQLKRLNINADIAYDGEQALEMHSAAPYDIIISDCHMPKMDGFELASIISENKSQMPIWLIAITADALKGAASKCTAAGFDDYLAKPCPQEQITNKMNHAYRQLLIKRETYLITSLKEAPYVLFNPHELFLLNDNDIVLSRNLAEIFINTWHKEKEHFLAELANHNFQQIYALAHKQKSVVRYLCGNGLEEVVLHLEKHAQNKNITKTQKSCLQLIKQFDVLYTEINHWLATLSQHNQFFRL